MGRHRLPILIPAVAAVLAAPGVATATVEDADGPFLALEETWAGTMLASRARFQTLYTGGDVELGPWFATRPLPAEGFADTRFPGGAADLSAMAEDGEPLWIERPDWIDGAVHQLPSINAASSYLYRTIHAAAPISLTAGFGSDDGIEVWLNGKRVLSRDVPRGVAPDQDRVPLDLGEGENRLLMKVYNISGNHGFYFRLTQDPVARLWEQIAQRFPVECDRMEGDLAGGLHLGWFRDAADERISERMVSSALAETGVGEGDFRRTFDALRSAAAPDDDPRWLEIYENLCLIRVAQARLGGFDLPALRRAVEDLAATFPDRYGREYLDQLRHHEKALPGIKQALLAGNLSDAGRARKQIDQIDDFRRSALLANPLLDFDQLLLIKRRADSPGLGLPQNWQGNCSLPRSGYDDALCVLSMNDGPGRVTTFFKPEPPRMMADVDLHWDGDRILLSMLGSHDRWQIFELALGDRSLRQVTPGAYKDVDNYDACYLPDGRILFDSTRCFQGIPCVGGADAVANLYLMDEQDGSVRRLCFDQDHNWCPTVLNDGRVLFTRWEYSDTPHYFSRLLMHMNPDGTGQMEYYGSNSFWPNSIFYARPIPDHPTRVVAIVSGHHGVPRMGELILFDPALGRFEADGVVQRIPGYGEKVEPVIVDQLVDQSWPRFLHPYPLSGKHFIVSGKLAPETPWGIYLVDVFDNMLLLAEEPGFSLLEPLPLRRTERPPIIPDRVRLDEPDATIFLADVYHGPGLTGIPRGTVKSLRLYSFHYGYNGIGGHAHVGVEGPWDVHRLLGTVPVYEDGSASFKVPANTPIAVQPLDAKGKALQLMRSWFTAMPGETLSCVGCHEPQNTASPVRPTLAATRAPVPIEPWQGPARGFSFKREVQPVLDRLCVDCHGGAAPRQAAPDLSRKPDNGWHNFTPSYLALHPYVRRPGPESDYHLLAPMEFHADTSELIQMLRKGHYDVELDGDDWDRLVTWIDLNVPDHGTWGEHCEIPGDVYARRADMDARYSGLDVDPEEIVDIEPAPDPYAKATPVRRAPERLPEIDGWSFDKHAAVIHRHAVALPAALTLDLGDNVMLDLELIPHGAFVMGSATGFEDEAPRSLVRIDEPFYMARFEVTCAQYGRFDPGHFNGYHDQRHKDHTRPGYLAHGPNRPVIRISWQDAMAFCAWLSRQTGYTCTLPTEAQWEWACRAGTDTPFFYGDLETDFAPFANLADVSTRKLAVTGIDPQPIPNPNQYLDYLPKEARFNDGQRVMADVGLYEANPWGLHDMHGNVCEWTRSDYRPYPYRAGDGRNEGSESISKVVRGGSWRDRPKLARSAWRQDYRPYQRVYNVGFRVVVQP
ncbi:MAG: SUMF1/EgtB/PvdO family nonheme iron enzyme [Planctomycetota bacterium]|jgi:formylglycine-generating enzyme required for sulfatase activity